MTTTDKALDMLKCGDRSPTEVARHAGLTVSDATAALESLVDAHRAVRTYHGGYVPFVPERGDKLHFMANGRLVGVRYGVRA